MQPGAQAPDLRSTRYSLSLTCHVSSAIRYPPNKSPLHPPVHHHGPSLPCSEGLPFHSPVPQSPQTGQRSFLKLAPPRVKPFSAVCCFRSETRLLTVARQPKDGLASAPSALPLLSPFWFLPLPPLPAALPQPVSCWALFPRLSCHLRGVFPPSSPLSLQPQGECGAAV